jgi:hypothetical protein
MDRPIDTDKEQSERLSWEFSSKELKSDNSEYRWPHINEIFNLIPLW